MVSVNKLDVVIDGNKVGTLAVADKYLCAFEYTDEWLMNGYSISPFSLPLEKKVFVPKSYEPFEGLYGVFADSLPDAWGRLLLERMLKEKGQNPDDYTILDRMAIVGNSGMGALTYAPQIDLEVKSFNEDLDELAYQCNKILNTEYSEKMDELYSLGGTSGGARPKILTEIDGEDWIIKFPTYVDERDAGMIEYQYLICAGKCGINMPQTRLFHSDKCQGYFGVKRFDRKKENNETKKIHMLTAAALLEIYFNQPCMDYNDLMKLTKILTNNNWDDIDNMYRRMCFNVYAHNRDDHAKNFTYIYDEENETWRLSPAYDLTYSNTYYGEHTTTVAGNGRNPGIKELTEVGVNAGLKKQYCEEVAGEIRGLVEDMLNNYI